MVLFLMTLGLAGDTSISPREAARTSLTRQETRQVSDKHRLQNNLVGSRSGRVILHTVCLLRHPENASWHWRGILRELAG